MKNRVRFYSSILVMAAFFALQSVVYAASSSPLAGHRQDINMDEDNTRFASFPYRRGETIMVTSTADVLADDGTCTLREAIIAANTNIASGSRRGECRAGQDAVRDIIVLKAGAFYSLTIDSTYEDDAADGDLDIWDNTTALDLIIRVAGGGTATISQDAAVDDRVLHILGATVEIKGLIITGGAVDAGGGIVNEGRLNLTASTVSGNSATAGGGGGIVNGGNAKLTMIASTISGNSADSDRGGGLYNDGVLAVKSSTISGNTAGWGGGLWNIGWLTLDASTVVENSATWDGGAFQNEGMATIRNGSVINNTAENYSGGGVWNNETGTLIVVGSTVSSNFAGDAGGGIASAGMLTIDASTVSDNTATSDGGGLQNRESGTVLIQNASAFSGNTANNNGGGLVNEGTLTLNDSLLSSNVAADSGGGINNLGMLTVRSSVFLGNSAAQGGGLYNTESGTAIIQQGSSVVDGSASDGGGGLFNLGMMTVDGSTVSSNWAPYGGGLFNWIGGTLTVSNTLVSANSANQGGGLTTHENSITVIKNGSIISGNSALWAGGGVNNWGRLTITDSALLDNTSPGVGDAINSDVNIVNAMSITGSCIVGNGDTAVFNSQTAMQSATGNWWGHPSGPSGVGPGSGDSVSANVDFSGWLNAPPAVCASH